MNTASANSNRYDETDLDETGPAEAWVARLNAPDSDGQDREAFERWLSASPANTRDYREVERIHQLSAELGDDELLRAAARVARRDSAASRHRVHPWLAPGAAIAATLAVAIGVAAWMQRPAPAQIDRYVTAIGEQRTIALSDGTTLLLDTHSAVTTRFDRDSRTVEVARGRVQFAVGRDSGQRSGPRPFLVKAGDGTIRDIGTTFQVSRDGSAVDVGLIEGEVEVAVGAGQTRATSTLAPGEQVRIEGGGTLAPKRPLDLTVAQAWPRGDLIFKNRRLDQLLDEMNRYSKTQLRLEQPSLGALKVSGVFHIDDQEALLAALQRGWSLQARKVGEHEILLHAARQ
ncbi:FecR domain-containing protein [Lysobacter sp. 5GHs7-4]|uniref:FecR family protein n=1 Tax=Lysobacter sp. 5GHs7-4 TaxID=2904253 RepID=UPI001E3793E0|nr:FecR domain-containing protein [Lysobacter sp. 5GHs7-4]UHQ22001.1 FecR domain-containing protein [Lysobacter sp. 5GHs7-4]